MSVVRSLATGRLKILGLEPRAFLLRIKQRHAGVAVQSSKLLYFVSQGRSLSWEMSLPKTGVNCYTSLPFCVSTHMVNMRPVTTTTETYIYIYIYIYVYSKHNRT